MAMQAAILIGVQGSGKSTFCREVLFGTHVRINLDMLRTRRREQMLLDACIAAKQSFVVDNTNITRELRRHYIALARAAHFDIVGYFFETPRELALERNRARPEGQRVPDVAIHTMLRQLEIPTMEEGFDELLRVRAIDGSFVVEALGS